jgi:hypothetical protein
MMNMFQLQERVKDFSKDQLVQEMQQPSGSVPPFLVLSELQRRTRMEQAFQADQAQADQTTVAQDAVNAAGVPQGGIADIAQAMAPQTDMGMNTGAAPMQPPPAAQPMMPVQGMYDGGVVRMQPGGLARNPQQDEIDALAQRIAEITARLEESNRAALGPAYPPSRLTSPSLSEGIGLPGIEQAVTGSRETPSLADVDRDIAPRVDRSTADSLTPAPAAVERTVPPRPVDFSEFGGLPEYMTAQRGTVPEPQPGEGYYPRAVVDFMQGIDNTLGDVVALPQRVIGSTIQGVGTLTGSEGISDYGRSVFASGDRLAEEGFVSGGGRTGPQDVGELGFSALQALGFGEALARSGVEDPAIAREIARAEREAQAAPITPLTPDADTPRPVPRPAREVTPPTTPLTPPAGPQTGGAGGRGGPMSSDRMLEQDKWLALAQFGLGLMASQAPSLGGAIGEAGTAALGQFGKARQAAVERDLAERTLAARTAGAGRDRGALTANQALSAINDQIQAVNMALALTSSPAERVALTDQLQLLRAQAASILSASGFGPATAAAADAGVDLNLAG